MAMDVPGFMVSGSHRERCRERRLPKSGPHQERPMSDPQPDRLNKKPPRAEPLQPDRPGRGNDTDPASADRVDEESIEKERERNETAHENTRKGYD